MFCLKNEELTLEIASHGAEMRSLGQSDRTGVSVGCGSGFLETDVPGAFPSGWKLP